MCHQLPVSRVSRILDNETTLQRCCFLYILCFYTSDLRRSMFPDTSCLIKGWCLFTVYCVRQHNKYPPVSMKYLKTYIFIVNCLHSLYSSSGLICSRSNTGGALAVSPQPVCRFHHIGFAWWYMSARPRNKIVFERCWQIESPLHLSDAAVNGRLLTASLRRPRWPTSDITDRYH